MSQYEELKGLIENLSDRINDIAEDVRVLKNPMIYNYIDNKERSQLKLFIRSIMKITFLGQAGFLIEKGCKKILIDPYLSDNVKNFEPNNYRRVPVDDSFIQIKLDVIVISHNHLDHFDKETLKYYFNEDAKITTLSPTSVWNEIRKSLGDNIHILFNPGTSISLYGLIFYAVTPKETLQNLTHTYLSVFHIRQE